MTGDFTEHREGVGGHDLVQALVHTSVTTGMNRARERERVGGTGAG